MRNLTDIRRGKKRKPRILSRPKPGIEIQIKGKNTWGDIKALGIKEIHPLFDHFTLTSGPRTRRTGTPRKYGIGKPVEKVRYQIYPTIILNHKFINLDKFLSEMAEMFQKPKDEILKIGPPAGGFSMIDKEGNELFWSNEAEGLTLTAWRENLKPLLSEKVNLDYRTTTEELAGKILNKSSFVYKNANICEVEEKSGILPGRCYVNPLLKDKYKEKWGENIE